MTELDDAVRLAPELAEAAAAFIAPPWRVAVVGLRSVGKSSWINSAVGENVAKIGLGGTTTELATYSVGDNEVIDSFIYTDSSEGQVIQTDH